MNTVRLLIYCALLGFTISFLLFHDARAEMLLHVDKETHTLTVYKDGKALRNYDIIYGRPQTPTPNFVSQFQTIDINPTWHPTASEIRQIKEHPDLIEFNHIVVGSDGRMYSPPGPRNPLGAARLNLEYAIKIRIHGTNEPELFKTDRRNYSHGCIRVLEIKDLAQFIVNQLMIEKIDWSRHYVIKLPQEVKVVVD